MPLAPSSLVALLLLVAPVAHASTQGGPGAEGGFARTVRPGTWVALGASPQAEAEGAPAEVSPGTVVAPESPVTSNHAETDGASATVAPAASSRAEEVATSVAAEPYVVAVLTLDSNPSARDNAAGVTALITAWLSESPRVRVLSQRDIESGLDAARRAQLHELESCERGTCLQELSALTGARFIITGRLDRFGDQYLLSANLVDTVVGMSVAKPRAEAPEPDTLLRTAEVVADELLAEILSPGAPRAARPLIGGARETGGGSFMVGLRINNNFVDELATFNPGADLEVGYWFHPEWLGFAQVGFSYVRSNTEGAKGGLNVLPSLVGARHYHNMQNTLRPYWGFGLGVQLSFGDFGIFQSTGPLPTIVGFLGLEYLIAGRVGLQVEAGTNVAQAVMGLAESRLGDGLNLDLSAGIAYHF
ncbi:hypothetical protein LZ198_40410 [Myxococcus sp. K15C18031901]|uniref:hypothetical protein n=1 Tax=Myxococcus dinghuensis TaxID=2906761 RepID=UPI0020A7BAEF|nr:hypothetical protein [Myxococcus dinghuensis]MCP3105150.1 hypothetical protein [Myxococcus dinghuensis]